MNFEVVLGTFIVLLVVVYALKVLQKPLAGLGRVLTRSAAAFIFIWVANVIGAVAGFHMGLNLITALTVGILGIPGVALLLAVKYFL